MKHNYNNIALSALLFVAAPCVSAGGNNFVSDVKDKVKQEYSDLDQEQKDSIREKYNDAKMKFPWTVKKYHKGTYGYDIEDSEDMMESPVKGCPHWKELKPCVADQSTKEVPEEYQDLRVLDGSTMYAPFVPMTEFPAGSNIDLHLDLSYYIGPSWSAPVTTWNHGHPPPIIRVRAGETLHLTLQNDLQEPDGNIIENTFGKPNSTNIHTHGPHISGESPGDNVKVEVHPGESRKYKYVFDKNHMPGTLWYHPHLHGSTALQTGSGVAGMMIVDDPPGYLPPQIEFMTEINMLIQQVDLDQLKAIAYDGITQDASANTNMEPNLVRNSEVMYWGGSGKEIDHTNAVTTNTNTFLINMQYIPVITLEKGKWYRMRMVMASIAEGVNFAAPLGCDLQLLAKDGIYLDDAPRPVDGIFLKPGNRADVAIRCTVEEGVYSMDIISSGQTGPTTVEGGNITTTCDDGSTRIMQRGPCNEQSRLAVLNVRKNGKSKEPNLKPFGAGLSRPCYLADTMNEEVGDDQKYELRYGGAGTVSAEGKLTINGTGSVFNGTDSVVGVLGVASDGEDAEAFDGGVANKEVPLGFVNEINYLNPGFHPHHQHVNPFQLFNMTDRVGPISGPIGGVDRTFHPDLWYVEGDWGDVFQYVVGGPQAVLRYPSNQFTGVMIYHCHILIHEDRGMMGWFNLTGEEGTEWEGAYTVDPTCSSPNLPLKPYSRPGLPTRPVNPCEDDPDFKYIYTNKNGQEIIKGNCNFVAEKPHNRCKKTMPDGQKAKYSCPQTCDFCKKKIKKDMGNM